MGKLADTFLFRTISPSQEAWQIVAALAGNSAVNEIKSYILDQRPHGPAYIELKA